MKDFVHLHLHSEYSLLEGACRIKQIPGAVLEAGQHTVAITDSGVMFGAALLYNECKKAGVKPVIGCELKVFSGSRNELSSGSHKTGTLVLLCENEKGYKNLSYISAHLTGYRGMQVADTELLNGHSEGLIALSGGSDGEIFAALSAGDRERAAELARLFSGIFGKENFYIELQNHGELVERQILSDLWSLSLETGLPAVATNDVHYLDKEDASLQTALCCIREGRTTDTGPGLPTGEYYLKNADEMERLFGGYPGALENSVIIADRCCLDLEFDKIHLPSFPVPDGKTAGEMLSSTAASGLERLINAGRIPAAGHSLDEYRERLDYELSVIGGMGYDDYFLIVSDYVAYAKSIDLPVGPGRGSGCGSLVAWLTGITEVDPIKYDLYFERFLNPERVSMPDIDIDFDYVRRDEMIAYVKRKYGDDRVSQIAAFGTMAARAALRDAARVCGLSQAESDTVCEMLPRDGDTTLGEAMKLPAVKNSCGSPKVARVFELASKLEGMPRNLSVHPAGVVISGKPVWEYLPLLNNGGLTVTQYDMNTVAALGLLKFDFLALRNLTVIDDTIKQIRKREPDFSFDKVDDSDPAVYSLISGGMTAGVFQIESEGLRKTCMRMRPRSLDDIVAAIALFRPGPMSSIPKYIEGMRSPSSIEYPHPMLEPVLKPTNGCIVYQEQVMSIFRVIAGYSLGRADLVRRAMAKKKASLLEAERERFEEGAAKNGLSVKEADALFDSMSSFAEYAFNKSHAVAYGILTFRTAYLKVHYPGEYLSSLMNSVIGSPEKIAQYAAEAESLGVGVTKPDVNMSGALFSYDGKNIIFGLAAVKGVGFQLAEAIMSGRKNGEYKSLRQLIASASERSAGRRPYEALIKCGALDSLGVFRSRLLGILDRELEARAGHGRGGFEGQLDIFSVPGADRDEGFGKEEYPPLPELSQSVMASTEKDLCGIAFTGRTPRAALSTAQRQAGQASAPSKVNTATPQVTKSSAQSPAASPAPVRNTEDTSKPVSRQTSAQASASVYVRAASENSIEYKKAANLAEIFEGSTPFYLYASDTGEYKRHGGVTLTDYLIRELKAVVGEKNVAVRYKH